MRKYYLLGLPLVCMSIFAGCGGSSDASSPGSGSSSGSTSAGSSTSSGNTSIVSSPSSSSGGIVSSSSSSSGQVEPDIDEEATHFYLSYDDSASTASRDLTLAALENGKRPSSSWGRAYEFLNAEHFEQFAPEVLDPFTISLGLSQLPQSEIPVALEYEGDLYALGVSIGGPTLSQETRKNVVLTLLVDISGSMNSGYATETRSDIRTLLDVTKYGLNQLSTSLKTGDVINLVTFETSAEEVLTGWQFSEDSDEYSNAVTNLVTRGSTNLDAGVTLAYQVANSTFDEDKANRVIILTDAYANTGQVNADIIANSTVINGLEGILFAGVGIGGSFNDTFLNELTDLGKSVYSAMVTPEDAERIFTDGFMRFVDHAVEDIQFRIDYPQALDQLASASEQISTDASEVDTVNYAYNSQQFFLELFSASDDVSVDDTFKLTITFKQEDGEPQAVTVEKTIADLLNVGSDAIYSAASVVTLAEMIAGNIPCDVVLQSGLFEQTINTDVFTTYHSAIEDFCNIVAPSDATN